MFEIVVMPLMELWADVGGYEEGLEEALEQLQKVLGQENDIEVSWKEELKDEASFEADGVDAACIYGLRAAAAWLEFNDSLDGFEVGDEPWDHEIFEKLEEKGRSDRFPHLLHSEESQITAFVPAPLKEVFIFEEEDDEAEEGLFFSIGSAPALREELDELRTALGLEPNLEEHLDAIVMDPEVDPLAAPRYGWLVLSARLNEGLERQLPMMVILDLMDEEEEEE